MQILTRMRGRYLPGILAAVVVLACGDGGRAETIRSADPFFALTPPSGYIALPKSDKFICAFATSDPADGVPDVVIGVQRLRSTIGPERIGVPAGAPPGSSVSTLKWNGFDLDVLAARQTVYGVPCVSRVVQVPLKGYAVQLDVVTRPNQAGTIDEITRSFLAGLDGEPSWVFISKGQQTGLITIGAIGIGAVLGGDVFLWLRARKRRRARLAARLPPLAAGRTQSAIRDSRAVYHAVIAGVTTFLVLILLRCLLLGLGPSVVADVEERNDQVSTGAIKFSMTVAVITLGISSFIGRRRKANLPASAPVAGAPPATDVNFDFDSIVDDRDRKTGNR